MEQVDSRAEVAKRSMQALAKSAGRRLYRKKIYSPRTIPGGTMVKMVSQLPDADGDLIGRYRVTMYVPDDMQFKISVLVEWTRDVFGFWYQDAFRIDNIDNPIPALLNRFRESMKWIRTTADGLVKVASMNRMFRKMRKNRIKDAI